MSAQVVGWTDRLSEIGKATGMEVAFHEPLSKHTYFQIGGPADAMVFPKSLEDLKALADFFSITGLSHSVIGAGSNLLVADAGYRGIVVRAKKLNIAMDFDTATHTLRAGAGVAISLLLGRAAREGWTGLEYLTGIPGTVGGVVAMNGGTHLGDTAGSLKSTRVFSFAERGVKEFSGVNLKYAYRKNMFLRADDIVWDAVLKVGVGDPSTVKRGLDEMLVRRKSTQPLDHPSCGSTFKNPRDSKGATLHAWQVIEKLQLRGHRIGNAQFSEKHCNFILNLGGATAADVRALIDLAKSRAQADLGVTLEEEVKYLGEF